MHIGHSYTILQLVFWTRRSLLLLIIIASIPVLCYELGFEDITLPWLPIALLGTASAFILGFKNSAAFNRTLNANEHWQLITSKSKAIFLYAKAFNGDEFNGHITDEHKRTEILKELSRFHFAWLHTLRLQLRDPRPWEHYDKDSNAIRKKLKIQNSTSLEEVLLKYLSADEYATFTKKSNLLNALIEKQIQIISTMEDLNYLDLSRKTDLVKMYMELMELQIKCLRIKNIPFPRQYASINRMFVWLFIFMVPFGMVPEFANMGHNYVWLTIPFSALVCWIFRLLQLMSDYSENPFEGLFNDVPINYISSTLEVDIKNILYEEDYQYPALEGNDLQVIL